MNPTQRASDLPAGRETRSTCPYCGVGCGVLIDSARIPNDLIEAAFEDLATALKS